MPVPVGRIDLGEIDGIAAACCDPDRAVIGCAQAEQHRHERRLAGATGTCEADHFAAVDRQGGSIRSRTITTGMLDGDAVDGDREWADDSRHTHRPAGALARGFEDGERGIGSGDPGSARVVVGSHLAQRQVCLRGEHDRRTARCGGRGRRRPGAVRRPTATSATDRVASSSNTSDDRNAMRSVAMVVDAVPIGGRPHLLHLRRTPAERPERRHAFDHVEEVVREPAERPPPRPVRRLGRASHERHEHRDERQGEHHRDRPQ